MAAVQALLSAAGVLKPNTKLLKKSTATEHATSSSQPDPAATINATEHAVSRLPLTGIRMSVSQLLLEKISQDTFCHTRSETRCIASTAHESLPVAHRRDGCDPINAVSDPEKRLRMWIASICTLGVNSFPRISLGITSRIASMACIILYRILCDK